MDRLLVKPGYETLATVLDNALYQAQSGKGEERHANSLPFDQQPMQRLIQSYGVGFALGQAAKKGEEAQGLQPGHDIAELLGAIVYLAGAIVHLQKRYDKDRLTSSGSHGSLQIASGPDCQQTERLQPLAGTSPGIGQKP